MKVVLRDDVVNVGDKGDICEVADGFARNFLIPTGKAIAANAGVIKQADSMRAAREAADARDKEAAEEAAKQLGAAPLQISHREGAEGKLFGSITSTEVASAIAEQMGIDLDRRKIELEEPIRTVGAHAAKVHLHKDVVATVSIEVVPAPG